MYGSLTNREVKLENINSPLETLFQAIENQLITFTVAENLYSPIHSAPDLSKNEKY